MRQAPIFLSQDAMATLQGMPVTYAGMCFNEPEEGDEIYLGGELYIFDAMPLTAANGSEYEVFGWYLDDIYDYTDLFTAWKAQGVVS